MEVTLAYGRHGLTVEVPDHAVVLTPTELPALADEAAAVAAAARPALAAAVRPGASVTVVFPDITRPMPNRTVLPPLLAELAALGAGPDEVRLLCATGAHRAATPGELAELVGDEVLARYRVEQHDAADAGAHVEVGTVDGVPVLLDRRYVEADVRVLTGFVEPHFFAGFSGGPKGVCPGLAGLDTILEAHSPARIASPDASWLRVEGNPVHDFVRAAHALCPASLSLDVAINGARRLTGVWCGPLPHAHREACRFVQRTAVQRVAGHFDVVVTTNAGYPLDRNLYQAVKGMAAAERVVRDGGAIVAAAECCDGVPDEGAFGRIMAAAATPADLVDPTAPKELDRWEAQVLGRVLGRARVLLKSEGLDAARVRAAQLEPVDDVAETVARLRPRALCVLPYGPLTVAAVAPA